MTSPDPLRTTYLDSDFHATVFVTPTAARR